MASSHDNNKDNERVLLQTSLPYIGDNSKADEERAANIVTIMIGHIQIKCKLEILQRNTKFFKRGVAGMVFSLPTCDVTPEAFRVLYQWMDKPNYVIPPKLLMCTYRAAKHLRLFALLDQFKELFSNPHLAREEVGFYMFCGYQSMNVTVPFPTLLRVNRFFLTMIGTPEYLTLWPQVLFKLLNSSTICINSEMEVLIAIILWLNHDYQTRHIYTVDMLSCVRFDCIPNEAIAQLRQHESFSALSMMFDQHDFQLFLNCAPPLGRNTRFCNRRIWIYDHLCDYHHDAHCLKRNFFNLMQFMDHQQVLLNAPKLHWWHRHQMNPYMRSCRNKDCSGTRTNRLPPK